MHIKFKDWIAFNIFSSHGLLPSDLVAQSVERRRSNPKVVGSIPTLVRVFLCPCVGPFPSVGLTLTWFIWDRNRALHITLYSVNRVFCSCFKNLLAKERSSHQIVLPFFFYFYEIPKCLQRFNFTFLSVRYSPSLAFASLFVTSLTRLKISEMGYSLGSKVTLSSFGNL